MPPKREKRNIVKPWRYKTTSSSEAENVQQKRAKKRKTNVQTVENQRKLHNDIASIKRVLQLRTSGTYEPIPLQSSNRPSSVPPTSISNYVPERPFFQKHNTLARRSDLSSLPPETLTSNVVHTNETSTIWNPLLETSFFGQNDFLSSRTDEGQCRYLSSQRNAECTPRKVAPLKRRDDQLLSDHNAAMTTANVQHDGFPSSTVIERNAILPSTTLSHATLRTTPFQPEQLSSPKPLYTNCSSTGYGKQLSSNASQSNLGTITQLSHDKETLIITDGFRPMQTSTPELRDCPGNQATGENTLLQRADKEVNISIFDKSTHEDHSNPSRDDSVSARSNAQTENNSSIHSQYSDFERYFRRQEEMHIEVMNKLNKIHRDTRCQRNTDIKKPAFLPMKSVQAVDAFNTCEDEEFDNVVDYLVNVGGLNIRSALNLCMKTTITDDLALQYSWWGNQIDQTLPFHSTKLCSAMKAAVSNNNDFGAPNKEQFKTAMQEALRVAKQRHRNKNRQERGVNQDGRRLRNRRPVIESDESN